MAAMPAAGDEAARRGRRGRRGAAEVQVQPLDRLHLEVFHSADVRPGVVAASALAGQEVDVHLPAAAGVGAIAEIDRLRRSDVVFAQLHVVRLHPEAVLMVRQLAAAVHRHPSVQLAAEEPHVSQPRKVQRLVEAERWPPRALPGPLRGQCGRRGCPGRGVENDRARIKPTRPPPRFW